MTPLVLLFATTRNVKILLVIARNPSSLVAQTSHFIECCVVYCGSYWNCEARTIISNSRREVMFDDYPGIYIGSNGGSAIRGAISVI